MDYRISFEKLVALLPSHDISGDAPAEVLGIRSLDDAKLGYLSFLTGGKYTKLLDKTLASVVLIPKSVEIKPQKNQCFIYVEDTSLALSSICEWIEKEIFPRPQLGIHPSAVVDSSANIDKSASIGPFVIVEAGARIGGNSVVGAHGFIGKDAKIGSNSYLHPHVSILHQCEVGSNCFIFPGVVLGADGFGYHSSASGHKKLAQIGKVIIEDDVEIGANTTIDRARFENTIIKKGTKIDNLVQIGHNVTIDEHSMICAQVGISGSTKLGKFVTLAGQVGVSGHLEINDGAIALGQAGITKSIAPKTMVAGTPARKHTEQRKAEAIVLKLPDILKRLKKIEQRFES